MDCMPLFSLSGQKNGANRHRLWFSNHFRYTFWVEYAIILSKNSRYLLLLFCIEYKIKSGYICLYPCLEDLDETFFLCAFGGAFADCQPDRMRRSDGFFGAGTGHDHYRRIGPFPSRGGKSAAGQRRDSAGAGFFAGTFAGKRTAAGFFERKFFRFAVIRFFADGFFRFLDSFVGKEQRFFGTGFFDERFFRAEQFLAGGTAIG